MTRRDRITAALLVTLLVVAGAFGLRAVPFFRVRQVELVGVRYLAPELVLAALALAPDQNVFDRVGPARRRLERLAGVVAVEVDRRLPGTLRVSVVERPPVAFVSGPEGMIPLDCDGRPLPYDPSHGGLDLPVVERADRDVIGTLCAVRAADSTLYRDVEVARRVGDDAVTLNLATQRVVVRSYPTTEEINAVVTVRRHLEATGQSAAAIDGRFAGWVVARRSRT